MEKLLVEKYRPDSLDGYVFSDISTKNLIHSFVENREIPNLIISGSAGVGKSTIARILIKELNIEEIDQLVINASSERGIDNVRDGITNFCHTLPMGRFKVVLLEECDGMNHHAQYALRSVLEDFSDHVRFILTCNYPNKIIPPIISRCQSIHIDILEMESVIERILYIIENENITVDNMDYVINHIEKYYPDMRKIINSINQCSSTGVLENVLKKYSNEDEENQWEFVWSTVPDKKSLLELSENVDENNVEVFFKIIENNIENLPEDIKDNAIIVIADHLYRSGFMANQSLNMKACIIKIFENDDIS